VDLIQKATHHLHEANRHVFFLVHPLVLLVRGLCWCVVTQGRAVRWRYAPRALALLLCSDLALLSVICRKKIQEDPQIAFSIPLPWLS